MKNKSNQTDALLLMLKEKKSEDLLKESFDIFFEFNKHNRISRITIILISIVFALRTSIIDTVVVMRDISSMMLDIAIAVFGIVFTGYTLFQAVLNREIISIFMEDIKENTKKKENKSALHETNWNFVQLMLQFAVMMFINILLQISLSILPDDFQIFGSRILNIAIAFVLLFAYFYQAFVILWRLIGFLHNIYEIFNAYAVSEYVEVLKEDDSKQ